MAWSARPSQTPWWQTPRSEAPTTTPTSSTWPSSPTSPTWPSSTSLFPASTLIPVTVLCGAICLLGVAGNAATMLIIGRSRDMKTTTNLYLSSMAASDLLIFLCLPFDLHRLWRYVRWPFGRAVCLLYHYVFEGCTSATILHIAALSVERYLAVRFPLRAKALLSRRRAHYVAAALWAFALASAAPALFLVGVESGQCKHTDAAVRSGSLHVMLWVSTGYFLCPVLCLLVLYGSVGLRLWRGGPGPGRAPAPRRRRAHRQTVKILVVVVLAFVICWLPYHVGRNLFAQADGYDRAVLSQKFNMASMVLCYLSASINPVVYNLMSRKYRAAARRLFLRRWGPASAADDEARGPRRISAVSATVTERVRLDPLRR
ncbi:growth hormone secretagogue receptor type 1 [Stigmatopora nigra]